MTGPSVAVIAERDDDEVRCRRDLAAAYRLVAHFGMDDSIYTHISARLPGHGDRFLINPLGLRFEEVTASNLVTVDIEGNILDDPYGCGINPAGFTIHSAVHIARHDVACVLHTHTEAGVTLSCQKDGLLPLNQWALRFHERIVFHDYEGIAEDLAERERLVADLGDQWVMILRNHGLLTCGRSVAEAFRTMYNLERACRAQLRLQASGAEIVWPDPETCEKTAAQLEGFGDRIESGERPDLEWAAYLRLLDRLQPDYRD